METKGLNNLFQSLILHRAGPVRAYGRGLHYGSLIRRSASKAGRAYRERDGAVLGVSQAVSRFPLGSSQIQYPYR